MTQFITLATSESGGLVSDIADNFGVTWQLFISQFIAFIIVALLLKKFAYKPVLDMLEQRHVEIEGLSTRHATLEDVFVHLTGRHLREGDDA